MIAKLLVLSTLALAQAPEGGPAFGPGPVSPVPPGPFAASPTTREVPPLADGGDAPRIGVVEGVRDGQLLVQRISIMTRQRPTTVTVAVPKIVDGTTVIENVAQTRYVNESVKHKDVQAYDLTKVRAFDVYGNPIPAERLVQLYASPRLALLSENGQPVDPAYLRVARDNVPLICLPPSLPWKVEPVAAAPVAMPPAAPVMPPPAPELKKPTAE